METRLKLNNFLRQRHQQKQVQMDYSQEFLNTENEDNSCVIMLKSDSLVIPEKELQEEQKQLQMQQQQLLKRQKPEKKDDLTSFSFNNQQ